MNSRIEQTIEDMERYIDECPRHTLSKSKIIVNKEEIMELLSELRLRTPEEIKRLQKIINNKEAILSKAQATAEEMIAQAQHQTTSLINEHQIVQQAYAQANEIIRNAKEEADEILKHANEESTIIRESAIQYTDNLLKNAEEIISSAMETTKARSDKLLASLGYSYETICANRKELYPQETLESSESGEKVSEDSQGSTEVDLIN